MPLPPGQKAVPCKWVYKVKTNSNGSIAKFKARLIAKGFTQTKGIDYDQTFSHVVKYESIRTMLAIAAQQGMQLTQFDVQTAYLNGLVDFKIYMLQPPSFEITSIDGINSEGATLVCLLLRSLYGLKQSNRIWNFTFHDFSA